ncbi:hypothetical protein CEXT_52911 [Caerostris extrusa]|uniref:C2H2-type domain-containing protein n=1 Tax=Caerostris extrusa TaxID=172846 RepID=A0AAV4NXU3_CAEEX|nr:hypothetical protein CEXT_52911 [Caerostris extrusa]
MSIEEILSGLPSESPSCIICHQKFFNRSSLRRHMERHLLTNRRRFQCDVCFKLFCRKDYVREHKQHMHGMKVESRTSESVPVTESKLNDKIAVFHFQVYNFYGYCCSGIF